jgi:antitoxin VapB
MARNIKNVEVEKLARKLSELTGESLTVAVTEAIRERLERLQSADNAALADRLVRIGKDCALHLDEAALSADHGELLFDNRGLPRRTIRRKPHSIQ